LIFDICAVCFRGLLTIKQKIFRLDLKPWRISEEKCSVYYKDFLCFCIDDMSSGNNLIQDLCWKEYGINIELGCGYSTMFCKKNSPGTWWFDSPYNMTYKLYDFLAHLSPRQR
jgi:hypothetical protein